MGLFDDDDDLYDDLDEQRSERGKRASRMERKHGVSHSEVFRSEFGVGRWSIKQVLAVVALLVFAGGLFVMKFGMDRGTISDRLKDEFGIPTSALTGEVAKTGAVDALEVNYVERNQLQSGSARLVGARPAGACYTSTRLVRRALPKGARVKVSFVAKLGRKDDAGRLLVRLRRGGKDATAELLRAGAARLDEDTARAAGQLKRWRAAESSARRAKRGLWAHCR